LIAAVVSIAQDLEQLDVANPLLQHLAEDSFGNSPGRSFDRNSAVCGRTTTVSLLDMEGFKPSQNEQEPKG
jgi:hypothetical protein